MISRYFVGLRCVCSFPQEDDVHRTIGINTEYLGTFDFDMAEADKEYLIKVIYSFYHTGNLSIGYQVVLSTDMSSDLKGGLHVTFGHFYFVT